MDESVREIQLSGKQLVFLFMAVTVVAVVIFLCGVLVGRGVRAAEEQAELGASAAAPAATTPAEAGRPGSGGAAELTYPRRLAGAAPAAEDLPASVSPPAPAPPPVAEAPRPEPSPADGFTVQVAALRGEAEAAAIAQRLVAKGYPAYVLGPSADAPAAVYRVRVGKYADRREAEAVLRRLEREERFRPWITR